ncbi:hypothetical protein SBA6_810007 [Candidatus Sulfopaludibacter sp. SbA6]|nr:hypothetical protein SBA6_810007 [Candidatus Sulfopaludibacter sp. SbA6]
MTPEERWEHIERSFVEIAEAHKSFDRRLERIAERHEALAQTVEIIAGMQRASEERLAHYDELFARNEVRLGQLMDTMNRLGNIIIAHDQRLDNLENR